MAVNKLETRIDQSAEPSPFPPSYIDYAAVLAMNGVIEIVQTDKAKDDADL